MYWVSKVAEATVGAAERRADIQHEWHIVKNNFKKSGFKQVFNLQHVNEEKKA